ncbi:hypothetical protein GCM10009624_25820 [Gordonia sinesedis]
MVTSYLAARDVVDLAVHDDLNAQTGLAAAVADTSAGAARLILVDVSTVTTVTASGMADLVQAFRAARAAGCDLRVWGWSEPFAAAHRTRGLHRVFRIFPDRTDAVGRARRVERRPQYLDDARYGWRIAG